MLLSRSLPRFASDQMASLTVVVVAKNRTGLVADVCNKVIYPSKATFNRTRMTTLGRNFGLMADLTVPKNTVGDIRSELEKNFPDCVIAVLSGPE